MYLILWLQIYHWKSSRINPFRKIVPVLVTEVLSWCMSNRWHNVFSKLEILGIIDGMAMISIFIQESSCNHLAFFSTFPSTLLSMIFHLLMIQGCLESIIFASTLFLIQLILISLAWNQWIPIFVKLCYEKVLRSKSIDFKNIPQIN